jgi:peptidoglycan/xylan/chitin deacetylase (PgdA/CDA1 family)
MYAIVYPLLKELGIKATFFIVPNYVGTVGYMNWDQMREMAQYRTPEGKRLFFFESHSLRHSRLGELSEEDVRYELSESKRIIEEELGDTVTVIALPFGSGAQEDHVMLAALKSGYNMIRTSTPGAINPNKLNLMNIRTFNVENYSNDVFVRNMLRITGR